MNGPGRRGPADGALLGICRVKEGGQGATTSLELSVVRFRPFDLAVFHVWSIFSHGPKRLTFWFQVLWAIESYLGEINCLVGVLSPQFERVDCD